jgi:hypothetical protein
LLSLPITILLTPFSLVPFALLYIRAREAAVATSHVPE